MFTNNKVTRRNLKRPPVDGCECVYCKWIRNYGFVLIRYEQLRMQGGDERHNPENVARLALKEALEPFPGQFENYLTTLSVKVPGRRNVVYEIGHLKGLYFAGGLRAYWNEAEGGEHLADLCFQVRGNLPPAGRVLAMAEFVQVKEPELWDRAGCEFYHVFRGYALGDPYPRPAYQEFYIRTGLRLHRTNLPPEVLEMRKAYLLAHPEAKPKRAPRRRRMIQALVDLAPEAFTHVHGSEADAGRPAGTPVPGV